MIFFRSEGVSQGRWLVVERSMGPGGLCLCGEGWPSWSGSPARLSPKPLQGSKGEPASSDLS